MRTIAVAITLLWSVSIIPPLFASNGYKIFGVNGAKATGQGEAFVAQADDPSAIFFNPAGIIQLKGTCFSFGGTFIKAACERTGFNSARADNNMDELQYVPNIYLTSDLKRDTGLVFGLGVNAPFGLTSRWSETGFSRYVTTMSSLEVININPTVAYRISPNLSAGAGFSYYYSEATMKSQIDYGFLIGRPGALDGSSVLEGDGGALGYNCGALYKINEKHSVGLSYRSPFCVTYRGEDELGDIPAFMGYGASTITTNVEADIHFPAIVMGGYAYRPNDKWKLEADVEWVRWQSLDSIIVTAEDMRIADTNYLYEWSNAFAFKFGSEYQLTDKLALRCGYVFSESAVPEHTFRPSLPDTKKHIATAGLGLKRGGWLVDLSGELDFYNDREIDNNVEDNEATTGSTLDGEYKSFGGSISANLTYKF